MNELSQNAAPTRESIMRLEEALREKEQESPVDCPLTHHFAPGLYAREIILPKDSLVVGKIHKHSHVNNISKGKVLVSTEFGSEEFTAPYQFVSKAGTKRAVLALEETIWTTYHPTTLTDLELIESETIAKSFEDYEQFRLEQDKQELIE